jgi:hypothetical protein
MEPTWNNKHNGSMKLPVIRRDSDVKFSGRQLQPEEPRGYRLLYGHPAAPIVFPLFQNGFDDFCRRWREERGVRDVRVCG